MGCGFSRRTYPMEDTRKIIVVFGATGDVGKAVVKALMGGNMYRVTAVTRNVDGDRAQYLTCLGANVVRGNLDDINGMLDILSDVYGCFFISSYWASMSKEKEIKQGKDAIYCARKAGVRHFVYTGHDMASTVIGRRCGPLDGKAIVDKYIRLHTLPTYIGSTTHNMKYTIIRISFLFENLLNLLKPHPLKNGKHALAIPMEDQLLDGIGSDDVGRCVVDIFRSPWQFSSRVVKLSADTNTVDTLTHTLNRHLWPKIFINPKIKIEDYENFGFQEARDLASIFRYYQQKCDQDRDVRSTRKLFPYVRSFEEWVIDEQKRLNDITTSTTSSVNTKSTSDVTSSEIVVNNDVIQTHL